MTAPHINETATRSMPRQAVVGELKDETTVEGVTDALTDAGIDADRIYFLIGQDGAAALNQAKGFFSFLDDHIDRPLDALRAGKTLVGVFGVDKDDEKALRRRLVDAGVTQLHYFGKWTKS